MKIPQALRVQPTLTGWYITNLQNVLLGWPLFYVASPAFRTFYISINQGTRRDLTCF